MQNKLFQTFLLLAINSAIIIGTVLWSGKTDEKTLYDKYIVRIEGIISPRSNATANQHFYSEVLDFPEVEDKVASFFGNSAYAVTPNGKLYFRDSTDIASNNPVLLVRVRNGIKKLHKEIVQRSQKKATSLVPANALNALAPGEISELFQGNYGNQFVTSDPDGNQILFYQKRLIMF